MLVLIVTICVLFLFYASYNIRSGVYVKTLSKGKGMDRVVALTFDDGPDARQTAKILDVLMEFDAKACFFCIGSKVEGNEKILERIVKEGHLIGNHSYSHSNSFPLQSSKKIEEDLFASQQKLEQAAGRKIQLFRPPFGVTNPMMARAVKRLGYTTIGWSIRSMDTCRRMDKVWAKVDRNLHPGAVILLHDHVTDSDVILREILHLLQTNGYDVVRIDTLFDLKIE